MLVPRTKEQAGATIDRLASYGAVAEVVPTISVEPPRTPQQMERAIKGLVTGRYEWIGFTSVNAVRAVREKFEEFGLDARAFAGLKVAAVGGVTAERAARVGHRARPRAERRAVGARACSRTGRRTTTSSTRSTGCSCRAPTSRPTPWSPACRRSAGRSTTSPPTAPCAPRRRPPRSARRSRAGGFDAVVFTSSSTVRNLVGIAGKPHPSTVVACIGPATAKTAEEHGLRVDVLAPEASVRRARRGARRVRLGPRGCGGGGRRAGACRPSAKKSASRRRARVADVRAHWASTGPVIRPRRLRQTAAMRRLVAETRLHPADLVLPVFVREGATTPVPIAAMPGVVQHTLDSLVAGGRRGGRGRASAGSCSSACRRPRTRSAPAPTTPTASSTSRCAAVVDAVGDDLVVMADLCLDEFTDHGHCGVLDADGPRRQRRDARAVRRDGAWPRPAPAPTCSGSRGMMDGQVGDVRPALDAAGFTDTVLLAYAAKYASAFYGPFREAVESSLSGDRATYQQDPANATEALREVELDLAEGADIVMVKPALPYLDVVAAAAAMSPVPGGGVPGLRRVRDGRGGRGERLDRPRAGDAGVAAQIRRAGAADHPHLLRPRAAALLR